MLSILANGLTIDELNKEKSKTINKQAQDKFDAPFEIQSKRIKDINNRLLGWRVSRKKDMHHG